MYGGVVNRSPACSGDRPPAAYRKQAFRNGEAATSPEIHDGVDDSTRQEASPGVSLDKNSKGGKTQNSATDKGETEQDHTGRSSHLDTNTKVSLAAGMKVLEAKRKLRNSVKIQIGKKRAEMNAKDRLRDQIWSCLEEPETPPAIAFMYFRFIVIFASAVMPLCGDTAIGNASNVGEPLDDFFGSIFVFEVIVRLIVAPSPKRFFSVYYHLFDVLAIIPFFVRLCCSNSEAAGCTLTPGGFFSLVAALRPILRMLKVTRHVPGFTLLSEVMKRSLEGLGVPIFLMCILVSFFAAVLFWVEEENETFIDVPEVVWFCVVTISTVGYGDVSPLTEGGRALGVVFILMGLTAFAMPLGVISGNFAVVYEDKDEILMLRKIQSRLKGAGVDEKQLQRAFQSFDKSGDSRLDLSEFHNLLLELNVGLSADNVQMLFQFFDDDNSGSLDYTEFLQKIFPDAHIDESQAQHAISNDDVLNAVSRLMTQCESMEKKIKDLSAQSGERLSALERAIPCLETNASKSG